MIEEPYRWVEAIATRRDYIEMQLATGSPVIALGYDEGILLLTVGQQKLFEIYDRIALGAIGHPGDIERLRMAAIELASTEGFTRSAADVSLRRLAYYSLSPVMKNAFEQIYGAWWKANVLSDAKAAVQRTTRSLSQHRSDSRVKAIITEKATACLALRCRKRSGVIKLPTACALLATSMQTPSP